MIDDAFLLLEAIAMLLAIVSPMVCLVKRNLRLGSFHKSQFFRMFWMKPAPFLKEDIYGLIAIVALGWILAFPQTDPNKTMFQPSTGEEAPLIAYAMMFGLVLFVAMPRLWWATGIPQKFEDEPQPKASSEPADKGKS